MAKNDWELSLNDLNWLSDDLEWTWDDWDLTTKWQNLTMELSKNDLGQLGSPVGWLVLTLANFSLSTHPTQTDLDLTRNLTIVVRFLANIHLQVILTTQWPFLTTGWPWADFSFLLSVISWSADSYKNNMQQHPGAEAKLRPYYADLLENVTSDGKVRFWTLVRTQTGPDRMPI